MACSNVHHSQEARLQRRRDRVLRDGYAEGSWKAHEESWTTAGLDLCCGVASRIEETSMTCWLHGGEAQATGRSIRRMLTRTRWSADAAREVQITSWETKIKDVKLPRRRNIRNLTVTAYGPTDRCNTCRGLGGTHSGQGRARTTASRTCDRSWNHCSLKSESHHLSSMYMCVSP